MEVYDNPKYYEIAFSFRDINAEVDFIEKLIVKYSKIPVKTFLELASGNSPHIAELCKRGYGYIGIESNAEMVGYANSKIKENNFPAEIIKGDMIDFSIKEPADCALVFLGSLYVKSDEELKKHLDSVARAIKSGGLYVLDGVASFYPEDVHTQSWEEKRGDIEITVTYKAEWIDEKEKLLSGTITLDVNDNGAIKRIEHSEIRKIYTAEEFISKAQETGFWENAGAFGDFDIESPPKEKSRNILVLRRK